MYQLIRLLLATCVFALASLTGCLLSAQEQAGAPVLRVVYSDAFPYNFTGPDGDAHGYGSDVMGALSRAGGYDVQFVAVQDPAQMLEMLETGAADLTALVPLTAAWRGDGLATTPLGQFGQSAYVRRDSFATQTDQLAGQRIGIIADAQTQAAARQISNARIIEYPTLEALILPLLRGEVDAVVAVAETFDAQLRAHVIEEDVRRLSPALVMTPYGIILRRDLQALHAELEQIIAAPATQARLGALHDQWFGTDRSMMQHPWFGHVAMMLGGGTLAFISLMIYALRLRRSSSRLRLDYKANQLLIDAFDGIRAAIIIFDSDMKAVHWNNGFKSWFPNLVPLLRSGATVEQSCAEAYLRGDFKTDMDAPDIAVYAASIQQCLIQGKTLHRIVQTPTGHSFDQSMFPLGERHYAAIWIDISELHRQQERITAQSRELTRANRQLLAFSSMAAHDLKAPLMQQSGLLEFILEDMAESGVELAAPLQEQFAVLGDLSRRMTLLVGDLLDYAKADSDIANPQCFSPNARLDGVLKLADPGPRIKVEIEPDMPEVMVDPTSFDLVMRNLITNAVKHHDLPQGKIIIRAHQSNEEVIIDVEDDGPGIAPGQYTHVFEPFARLTRVEGSGLGLALVKKTVAAWGGTISLRAAPARGCIFSITLPSAPKPRINLVQIPYLAGGPHPPSAVGLF